MVKSSMDENERLEAAELPPVSMDSDLSDRRPSW